MYALCPGFNSSIVMFFSSRISFYVIGLSRDTLIKAKRIKFSRVSMLV